MLRLEKSSSLRHIMSMCTDFLNANNGMMRTLAGTKLGVSYLEVILFTPKCPHAEIVACGEAESCINVYCLC